MRWLGAFTLVFAVGGLGCKRPNPGFLDGDSGTDSATGGATTGSGPDAGGSGSASGGSASGGSTTGVPECIFAGLGRLNAGVNSPGGELGTCGQPFESWGRLGAVNDNTREFQACDDPACTTCRNETFELHLSGPAGSIPGFLPDCTRVRLEREYFDETTQNCQFSGVVLSTQGLNSIVIPLFIGSSKVVNPPQGLTLLSQNLSVTPYVIDQCECPDCCEGTASQYELEFVLGTVSELLVPTETTTALVTDIEFKITNLQSNDELICGNPPSFEWTVLDTAYLN